MFKARIIDFFSIGVEWQRFYMVKAGCLGYTLFKQMTANHIDCVIMTPFTIATVQTDKKRHRKNDKCDAEAIYICDDYKIQLN